MSSECWQVLVKVCGVRREEDAHCAVKAGANLIGVIFAKSKRQASVDEAGRILAMSQGIYLGPVRVIIASWGNGMSVYIYGGCKLYTPRNAPNSWGLHEASTDPVMQYPATCTLRRSSFSGPVVGSCPKNYHKPKTELHGKVQVARETTADQERASMQCNSVTYTNAEHKKTQHNKNTTQ